MFHPGERENSVSFAPYPRNPASGKESGVLGQTRGYGTPVQDQRLAYKYMKLLVKNGNFLTA
jgi:hypothetical protein